MSNIFKGYVIALLLGVLVTAGGCAGLI